MGENSAIEWTHHTFNPWIGCEHVSPGCDNCYAELTNTFVRIQRRGGRELWGKDADRHLRPDGAWDEPLRWDRAASAAGERHRVFCASLADVFEDRDVVGESRSRLFDMISRTPNLDWLLLTKRPQNILKHILAGEKYPISPAGRDLCARWGMGEAPPNVWLGVTGENSSNLIKRVSLLQDVAARVRFVSTEPLLEDVGFAMQEVLGMVRVPAKQPWWPGQMDWKRVIPARVDWIILGGESAKKREDARVCDVDWIRKGVEICAASNTPVFVKQLGSNVVDSGTELGGLIHVKLKHHKGGDIAEFPESIAIRQYPTIRRAA